MRDYMGCLRGAKPLFMNPSPSPFKERGIKGVRMVVVAIDTKLITQRRLRKKELSGNYQFYSEAVNKIIRACGTSP